MHTAPEHLFAGLPASISELGDAAPASSNAASGAGPRAHTRTQSLAGSDPSAESSLHPEIDAFLRDWLDTIGTHKVCCVFVHK